MVRASGKIKIIAAAAFLLLALCLSFTPAPAAEAIQLSAGKSLVDNLAALKGKTVTVNCGGGQPVTGTVKEVSNGLLQLERLSMKEFYDALISVDKITSIEVRMR